MGIRLATVTDVKQFLKKTDNEDNLTINRFIESVSSGISSYCKRDFEKKRYEENYTSDGTSIQLFNYPVVSGGLDTFSVVIAGTSYTRDTDYVVDENTGIIAFPFDVSPVSESNGDASINYSSGYVVRNTTPVYPVENMGLTFDTSNPIFYHAVPTAATATDLAVAGNVNGVVSYKVSFANASGESELGAEVSITVANSQVSLTNIPIPAVGSVATKRIIYRTKDGGTDYFKLAELNDITTTTFTDNVADTSLTVNYYDGVNFDILKLNLTRAVYGTDYERSSDGISNKSFSPIIIKQKTGFFSITKNDLKSFSAEFSGECLFGLVDEAGNIFSLGVNNVFAPDADNPTWVNRTTLTPVSNTDFYLTKDQLSNWIEYFPTQAKRRKFGIVVVVVSGSEGLISSSTINFKGREWTSSADDDLTLLPDDLRRACIMQTAYDYKFDKEFGTVGRSAPDGTITLAYPTTFLPEVLRILRKYIKR